MIDISIHENTKVVDSHELYTKIGLHPAHYAKWIKHQRSRGGRNIDWFLAKELLEENKHIKTRLYFTLDFARAQCIKYNSTGSNQLIVFLKEEQNKK